MSINTDRYFEENGAVKPEALKENPWLVYLLAADTPYWNVERIGRMADKEKNAALLYVIRTLDILDGIAERYSLSDEDYELIRKVLSWSETAKAGSEDDRRRWLHRGYPLDIHNEASAMIYADHFCVRNPQTDPVYLLIRLHGLPGQYVRGECRMDTSMPLYSVSSAMGAERFMTVFIVLNECIIRAVDDAIWERVSAKIRDFGECIVQNRLIVMDPEERLRALLPESGKPDQTVTEFFSADIFPYYDLWYFQSALEPFGFENAFRLCRKAAEYIKEREKGERRICHLNFKPLADTMYYDYDGRKHVNIYKQRIIERWLSDPEEYSQHVSYAFEKNSVSLLIGVRFTPACEKLIEFCVEAERSGLLSYEKSIKLLYDTFGFRRDGFDRMNNEDKYLDTMNQAQTSTKLSILGYVTGNRVIDVGSGGGILLDELEKQYPEKTIIGTDISQNVIETLERKKQISGCHWTALRHNFVEGPMDEKADSIIFSSIIHEIYSYTDIGNGKFDRKTIELALMNAVNTLNPGGRIIIRDGIKTPGSGRMKIRFKTPEGFRFFRQFLRDFHGMDNLSDQEKCSSENPEQLSVITDINYGREFLYTYTWGVQSFPHEVQECFGYYLIEDFISFFSRCGMKIIRADSFLEEGYKIHLDPLVEIFRVDHDTDQPMEFPDSNCIVVAEKE